MTYTTYARRAQFETERDWDYPSLKLAEERVKQLLGNGYDEAWVEPASEAEALEILEAEVASLRARLTHRNRQIRDLRRSLRS